MSQSPVRAADFDVARDSESVYRKNLTHLNQLLRQGGTLSGHERNCAFLNTGNGPFATISSVSGFDFEDDARALALSDWDQDGDVDVWTTSRTAPRLRFLRNDTPTKAHWIAFRLQGTTCNRDAIGTRIQLELTDGSLGKLTKMLRAGEGFLSQSSKWVHFGLGAAEQIREVTLNWPDGKRQRLQGLAADRHYLITQGSTAPRVWRRPRVRMSIRTKPQSLDSPTDQARIVLTQPIPVPALRYETFDGSTVDVVPAHPSAPVLINLWASWCAPCVRELGELAEHADELTASGLRIVAASVDGELNDGGPAAADPRELIERLKFPFAAGRASSELIERLRTLHQMPFATEVELPVPTSFLIDAQARLAVIYRGPVEVSQLIADAKQAATSDQRLMAQALPLPGRWNQPPPPRDLLQIPRELVDRGQLDDALSYIAAHRETLATNHELPKLLVWLGDLLFEQDRGEAALPCYRQALQIDANYLLAMNNLAWQLATHARDSIRDGAAAVTWAERAAKLTKDRDPGILDTLAASYAEAGRFDQATKVATRAIQLAARNGQTDLAQRLRRRVEQYRAGQPHRSTSL